MFLENSCKIRIYFGVVMISYFENWHGTNIFCYFVLSDKLKKMHSTYNGFSIVIPTWNNLPYLRLCIESIKKNSTLRHQIIIAVNEGRDNTMKWLDANDLQYVHFEDNVGICYAVNLAASHAHQSNIMYMNDDMYVCPNWDIHLMKQIEDLKDENYMVSCTMIEPFDTGNSCVVVKNYGDTLECFQEDKLLKEIKELARKNWSGSSWPPFAVSRDNWFKIGGFSIEFSPGMYSDPDFSMKLYEMGIRRFIGVGNSLVYHFGSKSTKRVRKNVGRTTFINKWGISARLLYRDFLRMGQELNDNSYINDNSLSNKRSSLKNKLKRAYYSIFN